LAEGKDSLYFFNNLVEKQGLLTARKKLFCMDWLDTAANSPSGHRSTSIISQSSSSPLS
jgi:hypothetical protein